MKEWLRILLVVIGLSLIIGGYGEFRYNAGLNDGIPKMGGGALIDLKCSDGGICVNDRVETNADYFRATGKYEYGIVHDVDGRIVYFDNGTTPWDEMAFDEMWLRKGDSLAISGRYEENWRKAEMPEKFEVIPKRFVYVESSNERIFKLKYIRVGNYTLNLMYRTEFLPIENVHRVIAPSPVNKSNYVWYAGDIDARDVNLSDTEIVYIDGYRINQDTNTVETVYNSTRPKFDAEAHGGWRDDDPSYNRMVIYW